MVEPTEIWLIQPKTFLSVPHLARHAETGKPAPVQTASLPTEQKRHTENVLHISLRRCVTRSQCVSLAPPNAQLKISLLHSIIERRVAHRLKAMCHTFLACLSRAAGSAIDAIFLALHSRASV